MEDLSSFTSFVRDTPDEDVFVQPTPSTRSRDIRDQRRGSFISSSRQVSAIFVVQTAGARTSKARSARPCLLENCSIGPLSMAGRIAGCSTLRRAHGMRWYLDLVAQRPFDFGHLGAFGDCINVASRLLHTAGPDEIVISNVLRQTLAHAEYTYEERPIVDMKNYGPVASWRLHLPSPTDEHISLPTSG